VKAVVEGEEVEKSFTFGKGPLSVFSGTGISDPGPCQGPCQGQQWATMFENSTSNGFQNSNNTFPAAVEVCGGTVNSDVTVTGNASSSTSGFKPNSGNNDWPVEEDIVSSGDSYKSRYAVNSKMATGKQLLAVSVYNASTAPNSKGAAAAAGWLPFGSMNGAWTGEVIFDSFISPYFSAVHVYLNEGTITWSNVHFPLFMAVCVH
jgi:hypothetical protein